jgi:hypothetical protein
MPSSLQKSTASEEGAETANSMGIPAMKHFTTIS